MFDFLLKKYASINTNSRLQIRLTALVTRFEGAFNEKINK